MQKGRLLVVYAGLFAILMLSCVSAAIFSIGDVLRDFGGENLVLIAVFWISFALIYTSLTRTDVFKKSPGTAGVISFCLALLITFLITYMNLDIESFFYDLGLSSIALNIIVTLIIIAGLVFLGWKLKIRRLLIIIGALLGIIILATDWFYEEGTVGIIAVICFVIGILLAIRNKSKKAKDAQNP